MSYKESKNSEATERRMNKDCMESRLRKLRGSRTEEEHENKMQRLRELRRSKMEEERENKSAKTARNQKKRENGIGK